MSARQISEGMSRFNMLNALSITAAAAGVIGALSLTGIPGMNSLVLQANFVYGSGGTSAKFWIQTSIDGGANWLDVANFAFATTSLRKLSVVNMYPSTPFTANTTATDGTLADNTVLNGILGDRLRVKYTTVGTYAGGTTISLDIVTKG